MNFRAEINVMPLKRAFLDPQGKAVAQSLHKLNL